MSKPRTAYVKFLFELRSLSAATTRLALNDYFFGQTEKAKKVRERGFTTGDLGKYLNQARREIGLPGLKGAGPAQTYLRSHVVDEDPTDGIDRIFVADAERTSPRGTRYFRPQIRSWGEAWRFLFAPSHHEVRDNANRGQLSLHPIGESIDGAAAYRFVPSSAALPTLDVHHIQDMGALRAHLAAYREYRFPVRPRRNVGTDVTGEFFDHAVSPQIYLLIFHPDDGESDSPPLMTYVGQTTEPEVRFPQHRAGYGKSKGRRIREAFIGLPAPHEGELTSLEQDVAEATCINFFKEISDNDNRSEGSDSLPATMIPVRRGAAFSTAFCSAVLRLVKDQKVDFPFNEEITGLMRRKEGVEEVVRRYLANGGTSPAKGENP